MQDDSRGGYCEQIRERFETALVADRDRYVPKWMASWAYQDKNIRRGVRYRDGLPQDFYGYEGPVELVRWFNWIRDAEKPDYFTDEDVEELVAQSRRIDQRIVATFGLDVDMGDYDRTIGRYNAQDYRFQNLYPVPPRQRPRMVLDFGAGYGRQANLWMQQRPDVTYVGMDAIPLSYCLQHFYYCQLGVPVADYAVDPAGFRLSETPGVYHLPTWRSDLLPAESFDMVLCVQVLQEINARLLRHVVGVFRRILKPGGCVYVRDHDRVWQPAHRKDVGALLEEEGFELEFRPHIRGDADVHGIPRIYRRRDPAVTASQSRAPRARMEQYLIDLDTRAGGRLIGGLKALKRRTRGKG